MEQREEEGMAFSCGRWPLDAGKLTLVLIHGAGGSSVLWDGQVEGLVAAVNTVALDLPGHGRSPGPGRGSVADYAVAVAGFVDRLAPPWPVAAGLSMGGAIAQQLLLDYPGKFRAGILLSTGARLRVMPQIFETIEKNFAAYIQMMGAFAASPKTDPALLRPYQEAAARCEPGVVAADFRACDAFNVMDRLGEVRVPVLVVTGEDDKLTPPKYGDFLERSIAGARRAHVMDAGHLAPLEKPGEVNRAIAGFLDSLGPG